MRWWLHSAAKARGKTLDEYVDGGRTRWYHVHEEIAFDMLESMLEAYQADPDKAESPEKAIPERPGRRRLTTD